MKSQRIYCKDILQRIEQIERFTVEGHAVFMKSDLVQEGVIRCFEVIGEVVKRLDPSLLVQHPDIPWSDFAGFRDFLIHQYDKIDLQVVWQSIEEDMPLLKTAIEAILAGLPETKGTDEA